MKGSENFRVQLQRAKGIPPQLAVSIQKKAMYELLTSLIFWTPKLTGRAKASWGAGTKPKTLAWAPPASRVPDSIPVDFARQSAGIEEVRPWAPGYVSNPLPYIGSLNQGSSTKAPRGFIQTAIRQTLDKMRANLGRTIKWRWGRTGQQ